MKPKQSNEKYKTIVRLSWWILEQKLKYYNPEYGKCISDELYNSEELIYKNCCKDLGMKPTASNHVGFPWDTPSGRLVVSKLRRKLPKNIKTLPTITSNSHEVKEVRKRIRKRTQPIEPRKRVRIRNTNNVEEIKRVRNRPRKRNF